MPKDRGEPRKPSANVAPLRSSLPPPTGRDEHTLASLLRALASCEHPQSVQSPAVVVEPGGSTVHFRWCGACGAIHLSTRTFIGWIRPGLMQVLEGRNRLGHCARDLTARIDRLAELARAAYAASEPRQPARLELQTAMLSIEVACSELRTFVRNTLGEGAA